MPGQAHLGSILRGRDIFLCHTGVDKPWVENLAERIEAVPYQDRHLGVVFDKWDFIKGKNVVSEIDEHIDNCRFIGLVVSKAMLMAEWPTMERTIAVWSDPSGRKGRVLPLLIENADLPPSLRVRNWIDFREPDRFEEAFLELIGRLTDKPVRRGRGGLRLIEPANAYAPAPVVITGSNAPDAIPEQLVSNLLPVTGLPTVVQVAGTPLREKDGVRKSRATGRPLHSSFARSASTRFLISTILRTRSKTQSMSRLSRTSSSPRGSRPKTGGAGRWNFLTCP
jgi:hypothetical protein